MTPSSCTFETTPATAEYDATLRERLRDLRRPVIVGSACAPVLMPEQLGDLEFRREHGVRYAYVTGAMANGIASEAFVEAGAKAGLLSFFGAAGLACTRIEAAIDRLQTSLASFPFGFNFIHTPSEPDLENAVCDLYLRRGVRLVEASAFMDLTPAIVRYRLHKIARGAAGRVTAPNKIVAKVSRVEVAAKFLAPAPEKMLREMAAAGLIDSQQAQLAAEIPMASDLTVEADSGGHTDNRPLVAMFPAMIALRDRLQAQYRFQSCARVGAAGGISTPEAAAAAYMMGAAYVLTGSVNQSCVESGTSDQVRRMLAAAGQADCVMAPAADMFEMGVKVQVLKRGTMFAQRGAKLYETWRQYDSIEAIPPVLKVQLERDLFKTTLEQAWESTRKFFLKRDERQVERAEKEPKHKLALVFRSYLAQTSRWANAGTPERVLDYQIWCGPAMGAFNEWTTGTVLHAPENRSVALVARNILYGASVLTRAHFLRCQGIALDCETTRVSPLQAAELERLLD